MKFKIKDKIIVHDRGMNTHGLTGEITGIEPNTEANIYNVLINLVNKAGKKTGKTRNVNLLEHQIDLEPVQEAPKVIKKTKKRRKIYETK